MTLANRYFHPDGTPKFDSASSTPRTTVGTCPLDNDKEGENYPRT